MADRPIIPDLDELLERHALSDDELRAMVPNLRAMMNGLICGTCFLEGRADLAQPPTEWQAITIIDGTALCAQHAFARARADAERKTEQPRAARFEHADETLEESERGD